jgi:hypothetical protein
LSTAAVTATTMKLATRFVKSVWRDQNPSLARFQTSASQSTATLTPPAMRVRRT